MNIPKTVFSLSLMAAFLFFGEKATAQCNSHIAIESFINKKFAVSNEHFTACLEDEENIAESYFYLGLIARNKKELDKAAVFFESAIKQDPKNEIYQLELAVTFEWQGQLDRALTIYTSLSSNESLTPAQLGRARMFHWMGRINQSIKIYRDMLKREPENNAIKVGLGFALISNYQLDEARNLFEQTLKREDDNISALDGLKMLQQVKSKKLDISYGSVQAPGKENLGSLRLSYSSAENYRFRWGLEYRNYERPVSTPNLNSIPDSEIIENSFGLSGSYRVTDKVSLFFSGAREFLTRKSKKLKLQLELSLKDSKSNTILAGVIPTYSSSAAENILGYAGYVFKTPTTITPMVQLFYNENKNNGTSTALSASLTKSYGEKNYIQFGGSSSQTETNSASSVFANVNHYITSNTAISAKYLTNFFTNETTFTIGISHDF